jgi:hypothetical protein
VLSRPPPFTLQESGTTVIQNPQGAAEYEQNFLKRLQILIPEVKKAIGIAANRMKQYADKSVLPTSTESLLGQMIYVRNEVPANKLSPKFKGPYNVIEEFHDTCVYRDEQHYGVNLCLAELIAVLQINGRIALISVVFVSSLMGMNSVHKYILPIRRAALIRRCDEWFGNFSRTDLALTRVVPNLGAHRFGPATNYRL